MLTGNVNNYGSNIVVFIQQQTQLWEDDDDDDDAQNGLRVTFKNLLMKVLYFSVR